MKQTITPPSLYITETFSSIQGETSRTGLPTFFIRLSGCPMRCSWCDTSYSFSRGSACSLDQLLEELRATKLRHVCVTGGEPLAQKEVHQLLKQLCDEGFQVSLETGGALPTADVDPRVKVVLDVKCPGSKMDQKMCWETLSALKPGDEVKFVLSDKRDFSFACDIISRYELTSREVELLVSPVWGHLDPQQLVSWILESNLPLRLNMQLHRFIWPENPRGV